MSEPAWEFWIDVGGTFTDCIARRPDGSLYRHKTLSSGLIKGHCQQGSDVNRIVDPGRRSDPAEFWNRFRLRFIDNNGDTIASRSVSAFDNRTGTFVLDAPLRSPPRVGDAYELSSDIPTSVLCIRYLLACPINQPLPPVSIRLGTTKGTNALLTRSGSSVGFVTTAGFGDILRIGNQDRPNLFRLDIELPSPLFDSVVEIDERIGADGDVVTAPDRNRIQRQLEDLHSGGCNSLAICLMNAYRNSKHETLVAQIARRVGFEEISISSEVAPLIKIIPRGDTTVVDAYLNPQLQSYIQHLREALHPQSTLRLLTSAGGLVSPPAFTGKESILSGPAGGVVGFSAVANAAGFSKAIGFDMGGTSTDVSRYDGRFEVEYENEKAGVRIATPMLAIETVAAGGGSVCRFDGVKLTVGPQSAGADPGPACYGRGGPLAVTDINLFLGRILSDQFPFRLDLAAVERRLDTLIVEIRSATNTEYSRAELADGYRQIANANMTRAIRSISVAKGCDPTQYVLVPFGGAAGQHVCAIADELGIRTVLDHPDAGILSALGAGQAAIMRHATAAIYKPIDSVSESELRQIFDRLTEAVMAELRNEGVAPTAIERTQLLQLRYIGLDAAITIERTHDADDIAAYESEHQKLFGFTYKNRPVEIVAARIEAIGRVSKRISAIQKCDGCPATHSSTTNVWLEAERTTARVFETSDIRPGAWLDGPAVVTRAFSTTFVDPGWRATSLSETTLLIERHADDLAARQRVNLIESDPIALELFNHRFSGIAEQMGKTLQKTSSSVNVKERLDFSCAIFTSDGDLVVNAPHIPVHLGAMSETVKHVIHDHRDLSDGDVIVTNDPYKGGSHLPDVTVITPVFSRHGEPPSIRFFTASRAHHAEIGGITPGSMPAFSRNLSEEGVLIRSFKVVAAAVSQLDQLRHLLESGAHPSRSVDDNVADVTAQIAANQSGANDLMALIEEYSWPTVEAYMRHIQTAAETKTRAAIARLRDGVHSFTDHLDDGSRISVSISIEGDAATVDFTGTGEVLTNNLNANSAIVSSATLYCLRCLIDEDIPLNQGVLAPIKLVLPTCFLNPPCFDDAEKCAAVAGGNVETSQRIVDTLLGALQLAAASQGTMNNLLFGDSSFGYYETICGGSGATRQSAGAGAVHTHMTNTRLTDPEVLEFRYPVRLVRFQIRQASGGAGMHRGGDGVIRSIKFLAPLSASILSQRRAPYHPYGLAGGAPGLPGRNTLNKADGTMIELKCITSFDVEDGDMLTIETPGGGGFGASANE